MGISFQQQEPRSSKTDGLLDLKDSTTDPTPKTKEKKKTSQGI